MTLDNGSHPYTDENRDNDGMAKQRDLDMLRGQVAYLQHKLEEHLALEKPKRTKGTVRL